MTTSFAKKKPTNVRSQEFKTGQTEFKHSVVGSRRDVLWSSIWEREREQRKRGEERTVRVPVILEDFQGEEQDIVLSLENKLNLEKKTSGKDISIKRSNSFQVLRD